MPDVQNSQGATLTFNGVTLGTYVSMSPSWAVGSVHEVTSLDSPVIGKATDSRVLKQYSASTMEPGSVVVKFIGNPTLSFDQIGVTGRLAISWSGGSYSGNGFATSLDGDISSGELIQWSMSFQFNGYYI
jgi:hypothetical protein